MATLAPRRTSRSPDDRYFVVTALLMAGLILLGFSVQFAMGRSSFGAPLLVHLHALVFMGWVAIYVAQTTLAATGNRAVHRRLGWLGTLWVVPMVVLGITVTVLMVRRGQAPFFFQPAQFLMLNPLSVLTFAGLAWAAVALRRKTAWHRRLHYCAMALLLGPAFGRLLPMPLLTPWAFELTSLCLLLFPLAGIVADRRRTGRVHPASLWGTGVVLLSIVATDALAYSPVGATLYRTVTAGSPGAAVDPYAFAPPPPGPVTGR
jgi:hypothetical protein